MLLTVRLPCAAVCALALIAPAHTPAAADEFVSGHFRSNGKYVAPYMRSSADGNFYNNWSTKPNINPYKGTMGTRVTPPNASSRSYFASPRYRNLPTAPRSAIVTTPYVPYVPPVIDHEAAEAARKAAEAARAAEIAAAAKAYSDAKAQAIAAARANSDQRRKAFGRELDAERSKLAGEFESRKAEIVAEHAEREPPAVESDKAELCARYRQQIDQFDAEQAATSQRFVAAIASKREQLRNHYDNIQAVSAKVNEGQTQPIGEPTMAMVWRDEQRTYEQQLETNINKWSDKFAKSAASDRTEFIARTAEFVRIELANRIDRRRAENDSKIAAVKAARHQELGQRVAKLESEFERAEGERFAADQERAERRFLAYVHGPSIDSALAAEPVAYSRPANSSQSVDGSALTVAVVAGLGLLLALGAILSARSKPTDFRKLPPGKQI